MAKQSISPTHALLGLLVPGERYGYQLKRIVDQEFAPYWQIDFAQLYRSLAKMTQAGWAEARVERGEAGPDRKVYSLTSSGRRALEEWLAEPARDRAEFFVKVRLATECGISTSHLIESQRRAFEDEHARHADAHRIAKDAGDASRLVIAHAALRESEASLAALDLVDAIASKPSSRKKARRTAALVITGSDDPLLARLAQLMRTSANPVGSLGGLLAIAQHQADIAGVHLLDAETGEYNIPFIKHLMPEDDIVLVNLAFRENGLMIARDNPKKIRNLRDLTRRDIRFINRAKGTGTRLLLHSKLRAAHIDPQKIVDWNHAVATHDAVGAAISTGAADVGPGLRATAVTWNLDFIPLGDERYDLIIPRDELESPRIEQMLSKLHSKEFRQTAENLAGYDLSKSGKVIARIR
ncbi:MAG: helix-turn-helix transcriptional regulator [Chloroflexi bacterium]|nr:helix-turn-helix transcriptional regulator [Chloroflexota bacterium]